MVLEGVRQLFATQSDIDVVGEALNGRDALSMARDIRPDVMVLDISMPGMSGIEAVPLIKKAAPETAIVVLTMHDVEAYIIQALQAGVVGYVLKTEPASHLLQAVRLASAGKYCICPDPESAAIDAFLRRVGMSLPVRITSGQMTK